MNTLRVILAPTLFLALSTVFGACENHPNSSPAAPVFHVETDSTSYRGTTVKVVFRNSGPDTLYTRGCTFDTVLEKWIHPDWAVLGAWYVTCAGNPFPIPLPPNSSNPFINLGPEFPDPWGEFEGKFRVSTRVFRDKELRQPLPEDLITSKEFLVRVNEP